MAMPMIPPRRTQSDGRNARTQEQRQTDALEDIAASLRAIELLLRR
jgi:hypothetical protein